MNAISVVARRELRGFFQSPVALIFLGLFALGTHFAFFTVERFFGRNIADLRPLFAWLPLLLIVLVSAVTMRAWAEERKLGTLELLMTLPVRTRDLVLGKFVASCALVALALALTLPLPLMVASIGDLDWGPVVGGYAGALLLGASYVAIGLCVSARTDNQVVALMTTLTIGGAVYLIGAPAVVGLVDDGSAELLRAIGTGARFESIERGVLDVRDLVYYAGIVLVALLLNGGAIEAGRLDRQSKTGARRWRALVTVGALAVANVALANLWLAPVTALRADLTENNEYSLTDVTERALTRLDEPLRIDGYFSERSHPLLAPLVPQIRDLLAEYEVAGRGNVRVSFADPNKDEALEEALQRDYGLRSMPFRVSERTQEAVVNAFFHILVRYGDRYEVLSFDDLIEVSYDGERVDVRLRNLEYDVTRAVRRVSQDFQSLDSLLARHSEPVTLTLYATPSSIPEEFAAVPDALRSAAEGIAAASTMFAFDEVDPSGDPALQEELMRTLGVRPMAVDLFGTETFYLDVVIRAGERVERIVPRGDLSEAEAREAIEAAVRRLTPGQLTTVGLVTKAPEAPPSDPRLPPQFQPPPEPADFRVLEQVLSETYEVRRLALADEVPADVDVVLVAKPGELSETQQWALDQYLMRGGAVIALTGSRSVKVGRNSLESTSASTELQALLSAWGFEVADGFLLDPQNATFPVPVQERRGQLVLERVELMNYPLFPDVRSDGFDRAHPALAGLSGVTVPWSSPLSWDAREGVEVTELLASSERAWTDVGAGVQPDFDTYPELGFGLGSGTPGRATLAVAARGAFPSAFADRPSPVFGDDAAEGSGDATGRTLTEASAGARLAIVGSSELVSDLLLGIAQRPGGEVHRGNIQLVQNLIDWSVADTDLLEIRSAGAYARTLRPLDEGARQRWEIVQLALALSLVVLLGVVPRVRRRAAVSIAEQGGDR